MSEKTMKIITTAMYYDTELNQLIPVGKERTVSEKRAEELIKSGVAKETAPELIPEKNKTKKQDEKIDK